MLLEVSMTVDRFQVDLKILCSNEIRNVFEIMTWIKPGIVYESNMITNEEI